MRGRKRTIEEVLRDVEKQVNLALKLAKEEGRQEGKRDALIALATAAGFTAGARPKKATGHE